MKIETNKHGVNKKIKVNILPENKMREIGFTDYHKPTWTFSRIIKDIPLDITFIVSIKKEDIYDLDICLFDEDFGQNYDYQYILSENPTHKTAIKVKNQVENWMKYLQDNGVLSGHVYGEYI